MSSSSKQVNRNDTNEQETNPQEDVSIIFRKKTSSTDFTLVVMATCINRETGEIDPSDIPKSCLRCNAVLCPELFKIGNEACPECNLKMIIYDPSMPQ